MDDELHAFFCDDSDLGQAPGPVGADQHDETIEIEDSDWVAVGVEHVTVTDPLFAGAGSVPSTYLDSCLFSTDSGPSSPKRVHIAHVDIED